MGGGSGNRTRAQEAVTAGIVANAGKGGKATLDAGAIRTARLAVLAADDDRAAAEAALAKLQAHLDDVESMERYAQQKVVEQVKAVVSLASVQFLEGMVERSRAYVADRLLLRMLCTTNQVARTGQRRIKLMLEPVPMLSPTPETAWSGAHELAEQRGQ